MTGQEPTREGGGERERDEDERQQQIWELMIEGQEKKVAKMCANPRGGPSQWIRPQAQN